MKKIIGLFIIAAFVVVLPVTHSIAGQSDEVEICHVAECIEGDGSDVCLGKLKTVKKKDLPKYNDPAGQVDHYVYVGIDAEKRDALEETYNVKIPSSYDCVLSPDSTGFEMYYIDGKMKVKLDKF